MKAAHVADANTSTGPLVLWLGLQLGVVALAAARVPLAAQYAEPAEWLAPHLLLSTQVVAGALLFPLLLRDVCSSLQILATAIPFQLAAAYLAGLGAKEMLQAAGFVEAWLVTLGIGSACLRSLRWQLVAICIGTCLTLGGAAVRYLRLEFSPSPPAGPTLESASPLLTTLAAVEGSPTFQGWMLVACLALVGLSVLAVKRFHVARTESKLAGYTKTTKSA